MRHPPPINADGRDGQSRCRAASPIPEVYDVIVRRTLCEPRENGRWCYRRPTPAADGTVRTNAAAVNRSHSWRTPATTCCCTSGEKNPESA